MMDDRAGLFRPGWIAKTPVYGLEDRTASGDGEVAGVVSVLAGPPRYNGGRPMRAMETTTSHLAEGGEENCVKP